MIIKRFFSGFTSILPFINKNKKGINYFPSEIFKSDWRSFEYSLNNILNKTKKEK
jgi:hypothetical protein